MKRRNFIKLSATATAVGLLPLELNAVLKQLAINECDFNNRKLVLINLVGANDGLNTLVPLDQYDLYSNLRPNIRVPDSGTNQYITLDNTLASNQQVGLNPALQGFKSLYDQGWMRILQGVGYPSQNRSHFASTDLYLTGNDGNSWLNGTDSGWIGRFMELYYQNELNETYPLAVQIGSKKTSLGFHGSVEHGMAINITGQDPSGFYSILNGLGGEPPTNIPTGTHYGTELEYILQTDALSNQYSQVISDAFNNGNNIGTYPDTDLANQLKTVAKLISGGLQSKVYLVSISGFDTHGNQVQAAGDVMGDHYELLTDLSSAVETFFNDLNSQSLADDVVGLTFSEFGRKAAENGSLGTDHGEIAPMFVFGVPIEGGMSGVNPDLTEATSSNNFQIETVQHDYRQAIGTVLQNFLGASDTIVDAAFFNHTTQSSFTEAKIPNLISSTYEVPEECYNAALSINDISYDQIQLYPNPFNKEITIRANQNITDYTHYSVYTLTGSQVGKGRCQFENSNSLNINMENLSSGVYILRLFSNNGSKSFKVIKQ